MVGGQRPETRDQRPETERPETRDQRSVVAANLHPHRHLRRRGRSWGRFWRTGRSCNRRWRCRCGARAQVPRPRWSGSRTAQNRCQPRDSDVAHAGRRSAGRKGWVSLAFHISKPYSFGTLGARSDARMITTKPLPLSIRHPQSTRRLPQATYRPRREPVTVAIGFCCEDGLLFCADTKSLVPSK